MTRLLTPRFWLFVFLVGAAAAQYGLVRDEGWNPAWRRWHIDARTPHFSDLRAITGAADSIDHGFDPREKNPGAPFGQRFNQTSIWLWLRPLGIREADSHAIGILLLAGYAVGLWWLCAGIDRRTAFVLAPLILSPATLLAVERGTTDLSVFFLLALAAHVAARSATGAAAAVMLGFLLKLFPLAGISLVLREPRHRAVRVAGIMLAAAALFCALNFRELIDIGYKTEKGPHTSYGWAVLSLHIGTLTGPVRHWDVAARCIGGAIALLGGAGALWCGWRNPDDAAQSSRELDFFRVGASVYAGTFALGASWDYRLIFALFMVPQLVHWASIDSSTFRRIARGSLLALLVAAWSLAIKPWLGLSEAAQIAGRALEEFAKWSLFFSCVYLLAQTLPPWLRGRQRQVE